jgi:hypothetical protein
MSRWIRTHATKKPYNQSEIMEIIEERGEAGLNSMGVWCDYDGMIAMYRPY